VTRRSVLARVFVYGSLMRGETNAGQMRGRFVDERRTSPGFALHDLGAYPCMVRGAGVVHGELWEVSLGQLRRLDRFEDHPRLYRRELISLDDGSRAFAYLMRDAGGAPEIASGSWRDHRR
jgi:gamma-glutamylcyclotransferase (GGCT)/AIG2-like uncharacterized protein YtfP